MTIKILPPQLANQIAAGEVVERPASVVKELVENALDAGATKVEIDIERGGHKKIAIKDNGKGIPKDELALALSRHATSKISTMDDLEAIISLGFRGEALASISSVARLTLTSKPAVQDSAWSAMAEGLDMAVEVKPAAHPNGTSVEVLDLFFNTPARRKFLRAEKTEFSHIETLIRRIAMSRPDVGFVLKHNQKVVKRYRQQSQAEQAIDNQSARIAEVINQNFIDACSIRTAEYDNIKMAAWVQNPQMCKSVNPAQYAFVNGRMMRDKLLQHAIRQAYADELHAEQQPEYVVFIDLPANDVDVNVHPAKHEVRFHHARLLHDLLVGLIQEALADFSGQQQSIKADVLEEVADAIQTQTQSHEQTNVYTQARNITSTQQPDSFPGLKPLNKTQQSTTSSEPFRSELRATNYGDRHQYRVAEHLIDKSAVKQASVRADSSFQVLKVKGNYALVMFQQSVWAVDLSQIIASQSEVNLTPEDLASTPLLVPTRLKLTADELNLVQGLEEPLQDLGFELKVHNPYVIVKQVPSIVRASIKGQFIPALFDEFLKHSLAELSADNHSKIKQLLSSSQQLSFGSAQINEKLDIMATRSDFNNVWSNVAREIDPAQFF